ncbi:DNA-binding anti-repressor SinI [Alkalihalobacterium elongatum]|uniref:DNA-binding anti-repressor SinI n=1 Tax=Alkalihalobacterium elongatum TaxID=2675466 RepID=UPI001C1F52D6|nr:DNA-binding anti-repressor SinI [Alkalihalobacterium elongatum]
MNQLFSLVKKSNLDEEWIFLMKKAKQIGLEPNEVKTFLTQVKSQKDEIKQ